jgi:drug/metabolite transporter (DMT)-like permease
MITYWILTAVIAFLSSLSVFFYNYFLARTKSAIIRVLLEMLIMWPCILLPVAGIYILHRHYHENLFFGARGVSIAAVMITAFITHIVLLARQK